MDCTDRYYQAPWGTLLKVMSTLASLVIVGVFGSLLFTRDISTIEKILFTAFPLALLTGCLLFVVRGFTVSGGILKIRRLLWTNHVDISTLQSAVHDSKAMTGSIRTMGNGGLFSFSGRYRSRKLGSFRAYVNDFRNCVILRCSDKTLVVSPENPEIFAEILRNRCGDG